MKPNSERIIELFSEAMAISSPDERARFLDRACQDEPEVREEVESLLRAGEPAADFLKQPPPGPERMGDLVTEKPGDVFGPYKLLQQIGEGGFGVVWMAEQSEPILRKVALKVIKAGMDSKQVLARFEAERQALAMMDHPNIARVFDAGATPTGRPYFAMELVKGIPITEFCDQQKLGTRQRLELFCDVCSAVNHAHQKGIIHRDLKPSNVMMTLDGDRGVAKVIDFGIAKATELKLTDKTLFTRFEQFLGTPVYMSPEQAAMSATDIDTRSDIYSLGMLLYELLAGRPAFDPKTLLAAGYDEMRRIIKEDEPPRPSVTQRRTQSHTGAVPDTSGNSALHTSQSALDPDLDWIVMKCLEKDRSRRYETANALAADLQRHLTNEPVMARPASKAYRVQKAFRRNRLAFTAAAAVAMALLAGGIVSTWQAIEARQARDAEKQERLRAKQGERVARHVAYDSDMNLAQQSLKLNNFGKACRLLDRHRPKPGEEDLRGWEWRYLWQLTRSTALVTLTNRQTYGDSVSFSSDGKRLAAGWGDGRVEVWDVPGRRLIQTLTGSTHPHQGRLAFSPVCTLLAVTSGPGEVSLHDLDSGRESILWRAPDQGRWDVRDLTFSQDGSRVVIYAGSHLESGDEVWVVNVSPARVEIRHPTAVRSGDNLHGAARLSPDNQRLYLARSDASNYRYSIQCIELSTGKELWQTESQRDEGLTALAVSPGGQELVSGSGYEDPTIGVWDAATGRLLDRLKGHTKWVSELAFTRDGRLISAASDQSIRFWNTGTWTETQVLRGHKDEVCAVAISENAHLVASASKDGDLILWRDDGKSAADGYCRLPEELRDNQVLSLDHSRLLLLPPGKPPELVDLKSGSPPVPVVEIGPSANVLGCFDTNLLFHWNGTNQILVRELRGSEFIQRGTVPLDSDTRPAGIAYTAMHQLVAWAEGSSSAPVYLANLDAPDRRTELKSDVPGLVPFRFSEDGNYLSAVSKGSHSLRAWNVKTRQVVASIGEKVNDQVFAAGGQVLVVTIAQGDNHEIRFYDLAHPDRAPRRSAGRDLSFFLAVSPDGRMVASATVGGLVRLFDPATGELIEPLDGHMNSADAIAFSADGRRLISTSTAQEKVKLWDVATRQELLTLSGTGREPGTARWSADGDVIVVGAPWQAWRAPSWEEIEAAEKEGK